MERATSFGTDAVAYQLGRPGYVDEHVAWLLDGVAGRVLDLAAGSGKLTRAIVRLGFETLAVDPDERMLAQLDVAPTLAGRAESIPAPDASFAAVTVGQAWHWFDPQTVAPELARVLGPGGRLGLIWNTRDATDPFVAALAPIMGASPAEQLVDADRMEDLTGFTPFERRRWKRIRTMTPAELEAMVTSRSAYLLAEPEAQAAMLGGVRTLLATHPHTAGRQSFGYALNTTAYRATRLA